MLIPHEEKDPDLAASGEVYKVIKPELISFISYPYEWCFSQLKDAALFTLEIQKLALEFGMSLKDCSAYNIQFWHGRPIFIDTLSFEIYQEGKPWEAYRQYCQHFLAPLTLMSYTDVRLGQLLRIYLDGIPLDLASTLLPLRTHFKFGLLSHIHLHAKSQKHFGRRRFKIENKKMSRVSFLGIIDSLESAIKKLRWEAEGTEWGEYYEDTNYSEKAFESKKEIISRFLDRLNPESVWDFGANVGMFSRIAAEKNIPTTSFDIDPAAVDKNYRDCVKNNESNILPLILDLTNPSGSIGWGNNERMSLLERGPVDVGLALALMHHLAISNNVPLSKIASFFAESCKSLIIEFVPKKDSQVQRLLCSREDIFADYTQERYETEFRKYFVVLESAEIQDSERRLYLMRRDL
jgi:hypothetical protein